MIPPRGKKEQTKDDVEKMLKNVVAPQLPVVGWASLPVSCESNRKRIEYRKKTSVNEE